MPSPPHLIEDMLDHHEATFVNGIKCDSTLACYPSPQWKPPSSLLRCVYVDL